MKLKSNKKANCITKFTNVLLISTFWTLTVYFIALLTLYLLLRFDQIRDPAQLINKHELCKTSNSIQYSFKNNEENLNFLTSVANDVNSEIDGIQFICYRSLYQLVRIKNEFRNFSTLDLCLFSNNIDHILIIHRLNEITKSNGGFNFVYDPLFGYYSLTYKNAELTLYTMTFSSGSKYEFETFRRTGLVYTQFSYLIELLKAEYLKNSQSSSTSISLQLLDSVCFYYSYPFYLIENMLNKVTLKINNQSFFYTNDPHFMLMNSYPNLWWQHFANCSI
jgi:hypothetical protein